MRSSFIRMFFSLCLFGITISISAQEPLTYEEQRANLAIDTYQKIMNAVQEDGRMDIYIALLSNLEDVAEVISEEGDLHKPTRMLEQSIADFFCLNTLDGFSNTEARKLYLQAISGNGCTHILNDKYFGILEYYFEKRNGIDTENGD